MRGGCYDEVKGCGMLREDDVGIKEVRKRLERCRIVEGGGEFL